jgi:soluble lytic murein transglycosylase-like protein
MTTYLVPITATALIAGMVLFSGCSGESYTFDDVQSDKSRNYQQVGEGVARACGQGEQACKLAIDGAWLGQGLTFKNPYDKPKATEVAQAEQSPKPQLRLEQTAQAHPVPVLAKVASSDGRPVGKAWEALSDKEKAQWYAKDAAYKYGVPFALMHSLFWQESGFNPKAYNNCDAAGVGQMIKGTAEAMGLKTSVIKLKKPMRCGKYVIWHKATPADERFNAKKNIEASVKYFAGLRKHYGNDKLALVHYNGGSRAVRAWLKANGYGESKNYVSSIMSNAQRMGYGG